MVQRPQFLVTRDRIGSKLDEWARLLENPDNRLRVQADIARWARG